MPSDETYDWAAQGHQGVVLRARRLPDGGAILGTFHEEQEGPALFLQLSPEALMALLEYLVGSPPGTALN